MNKLMSSGTAIDYIKKKATEKISKPPLNNYPAPFKILEVSETSCFFCVLIPITLFAVVIPSENNTNEFDCLNFERFLMKSFFVLNFF